MTYISIFFCCCLILKITFPAVSKCSFFWWVRFYSGICAVYDSFLRPCFLRGRIGSRVGRCTAQPSYKCYVYFLFWWFLLCTPTLRTFNNKDNHMIYMGRDLPSSSQHSLPMPRGAPTLNHIGAQQLSLWNWFLLVLVVRITMQGANDDDGKADLRFVKKFTRPDFGAKKFTH